ncbi:DUF1766-domain-containing protein [Glonium stellatum]|uniref:DUF1766-domain-containing protein n=1 Tax=Glonium stellatum TaxID=574774 RepID=A0A8E2FCW2_9PEZI|nr:DUF1766-domain-containing protein [Glonium stellatum]
MPFIPHTPESLLPRSDSKNPATTCKGITSGGRPCRRSLATATSPARSSASATNGVLAIVSVGNSEDGNGSEAAAFFCWQHKDQAEQLVAADSSAQRQRDVTKLLPLKERSSIDTLVARLGVLDIEEPNSTSKRKARKERHSNSQPLGDNPHRRVNRPPTWENVSGPLMSVPEDLVTSAECQTTQKQGTYRAPPRRQKKQGFWETLCCMGAPEEDYVEVVRHKKRVHGHPTETPQSIGPTPAQPERYSQYAKKEQREKTGPQPNPEPTPQSSTQRLGSNAPVRTPLSDKPARPINKPASSSKSETSTLLSYIPTHLSPQTTSLLLAELSKPISQHDDEGFIYIFWLTSEDSDLPPAAAAASLLTPPSRPTNGRRPSDVIRDYSNSSAQTTASSKTIPGAWSTEGRSKSEKKTMLLKIGRASNVHRRMNEWTRQCGYSLSLVRFYPYVPSTPSPSPSPAASPANSRRPSLQPSSRPADPVRRVSENSSAGVRKVPHAHRVERLIHIELGERRVKRDCATCGKEHREWFEVDATREGVKEVDEVVRRWVGWAERAEV